MPLATASASVVRNASRNSSKLSTTNDMAPPLGSDQWNVRWGPGGPHRTGGSVPVDGRGLGGLRAGDVTGGAVPGLGPGAVVEGLLENVVDEVAELGVAQLEVVRAAGDQTGEDDVVGRDGLHVAVLQVVGALRVDVVRRQLRLGVVVPDVLGRRRALDRADG